MMMHKQVRYAPQDRPLVSVVAAQRAAAAATATSREARAFRAPTAPPSTSAAAYARFESPSCADKRAATNTQISPLTCKAIKKAGKSPPCPVSYLKFKKHHLNQVSLCVLFLRRFLKGEIVRSEVCTANHISPLRKRAHRHRVPFLHWNPHTLWSSNRL